MYKQVEKQRYGLWGVSIDGGATDLVVPSKFSTDPQTHTGEALVKCLSQQAEEHGVHFTPQRQVRCIHFI